MSDSSTTQSARRLAKLFYKGRHCADDRSVWWSQTGSNRRPHACKARALPAELWPRTRRRMLTLNERHMRSIKVVGLGRLELPTSRLSSARSNQLSYKPSTPISQERVGACSRTLSSRQMHRTSAAPGACSSAKKEKRRRRNPANGAQRSGDRWPLMFLKRLDRSKLLKNHP